MHLLIDQFTKPQSEQFHTNFLNIIFLLFLLISIQLIQLRYFYSSLYLQFT